MADHLHRCSTISFQLPQSLSLQLSHIREASLKVSNQLKSLCVLGESKLQSRVVTFWLSLLLVANKLTYQLPNPLRHLIWQLSLCLR